MKFNFKFKKKKRTYNDAFSNGELNKFPIDNRDINQYALLYRYFPNYAETLL